MNHQQVAAARQSSNLFCIRRQESLAHKWLLASWVCSVFLQKKAVTPASLQEKPGTLSEARHVQHQINTYQRRQWKAACLDAEGNGAVLGGLAMMKKQGADNFIIFYQPQEYYKCTLI